MTDPAGSVPASLSFGHPQQVDQERAQALPAQPCEPAAGPTRNLSGEMELLLVIKSIINSIILLPDSWTRSNSSTCAGSAHGITHYGTQQAVNLQGKTKSSFLYKCQGYF